VRAALVGSVVLLLALPVCSAPERGALPPEEIASSPPEPTARPSEETGSSPPVRAALPPEEIGRFPPAATSQQADDVFARARAALLSELRRQGIRSEEVLAAIERVPRERFVPAANRDLAYGNHPLPIGRGQTISQPFIVALMSELLETEAGDRVLEIGTGSGYQAAILAELGCEVFSIEIVGELAAGAEALLGELGYERVHVRHGDGYLGWPEEAPFDKVIVTAAPEEIPAALVEQLRVGGKMVIPVGPQGAVQQLTLLEKGADGSVTATRSIPVAFVPMVR